MAWDWEEAQCLHDLLTKLKGKLVMIAPFKTQQIDQRRKSAIQSLASQIQALEDLVNHQRTESESDP